jgi:hypothetical protein
MGLRYLHGNMEMTSQSIDTARGLLETPSHRGRLGG